MCLMRFFWSALLIISKATGRFLYSLFEDIFITNGLFVRCLARCGHQTVTGWPRRIVATRALCDVDIPAVWLALSYRTSYLQSLTTKAI